LIARLATRVLVTAEEAVPELPREKVSVAGYPVRQAVRDARRDSARAKWGLPDEGQVLLVFGGSQGARRLNRAVVAAAAALLGRMHVLHITGTHGFAAVTAARSQLDAGVARRWHVFEYLHDADRAAARAAADRGVSRAGAATLGEYPARGLPAVLVPLPLAGHHQADNARVLADAGAAVVIPDDELDGDRLVRTVTEIMSDRERLISMASAARSLDRPGATEAIWRALVSLAGDREQAA
jgi:UDP-N-acetylglucosamine--N-acetylmuramyl-(pentapeptide) pyrophosphoryl-undecaprenol N-acetylglucosamine transferase